MQGNLIGFPNMGIGEFALNPVALSVFGIEVRWYGICIAVGFLIAFLYALREAKRVKLEEDVIYDIVLLGLPISVICARIYYVIFAVDEFKGDFMKVFAFWDGGIAIYGALIGAVLTAYIYCKKKEVNALKMFDIGAIGLLIGQTIGRWGNFFNAEVYGVETNLPWGMTINGGGPFHPVFLYESLWNLIGLIVLLSMRKKKRFNGEIFWLYVLWYGVGRAFLESLRVDQYVLKFLSIPSSQWTAILTAVIALGVLVYLSIKNKNKDISEVNEEISIEGNNTANDEITAEKFVISEKGSDESVIEDVAEIESAIAENDEVDKKDKDEKEEK